MHSMRRMMQVVLSFLNAELESFAAAIDNGLAVACILQRYSQLKCIVLLASSLLETSPSIPPLPRITISSSIHQNKYEFQ